MPLNYEQLRQNPNVQRFLNFIGWMEGAGYNTHYGGGTFSGYNTKPRHKVTAGGYTSSASGKYQFINDTWDYISRKIGRSDFSPQTQDYAAIQLIADRGALNDVLSGNWQSAITKTAGEWASFPNSPTGTGGAYGQAKRTMSQALGFFGGSVDYSATIGASSGGYSFARFQLSDRQKTQVKEPISANLRGAIVLTVAAVVIGAILIERDII